MIPTRAATLIVFIFDFSAEPLCNDKNHTNNNANVKKYNKSPMKVMVDPKFTVIFIPINQHDRVKTLYNTIKIDNIPIGVAKETILL